MSTIREVARLAGVSPATVSRVMNGTANVDSDKRQRVEQAIRESGFLPNKLARALFKNSSGLIGLIIPNIENPFFPVISWHLIKINTENKVHKAKDIIKIIPRNNPKYLIIIGIDNIPAPIIVFAI